MDALGGINDFSLPIDMQTDSCIQKIYKKYANMRILYNIS